MKRVKKTKSNLNKNALTNSFRVVGIKIFCFYLVLLCWKNVQQKRTRAHHIKREQIEFKPRNHALRRKEDCLTKKNSPNNFVDGRWKISPMFYYFKITYYKRLVISGYLYLSITSNYFYKFLFCFLGVRLRYLCPQTKNGTIGK